ncbi:MAG TPA: phosphoribosylglycinamide formyltransferase [Flavobacteriales bacterium]|nr:phosphoribosylglycinamide formyltransferase [Flavobacteriales bacterium]
MKRIAIFASGKGSNVENLIRYFKNHPLIGIALVVSNNAQAGAVQIATKNHVDVLLLAPHQVNDGVFISQSLKAKKINYVVLAGYLKMIPADLIKAFPDKIINIHPALLPKFGGKGMYGSNIHKAVIQSGETESGITVHFVNEEYDQGRIIAQKAVKLDAADSFTEVENKVRLLEMEWFPTIVEQVISATETE